MSQIWVARILQVTLTYWKLDSFWWRLPPAVILHIREVQTPSQSDPELSDTQPLDLQLSFEINVASAWIIMLNIRWDGPNPITWSVGPGFGLEKRVAAGILRCTWQWVCHMGLCEGVILSLTSAIPGSREYQGMCKIKKNCLLTAQNTS